MSFLLLTYFMFHRPLYMCELQPAQSKMVFKVRLRSLSAIVIAFQAAMFICRHSVYQETLFDIQMIFSLYSLLTPRTDLQSTQLFYAAFDFFFFFGCLWKTAKTLLSVEIIHSPRNTELKKKSSRATLNFSYV